MARDSDFEQFRDLPGILHPLDDISKRVFHRNTRLVINRMEQRASKIALRRLQGYFGNGIRPFGDGKAVLKDLTHKYEQATGDDKTAYQLILDNTFVIGDFVLETASRHYKSMWLRDGWFTAMYADSDPLKKRFVEEFGNMQNENGQIPTEVYYLPSPLRMIKQYRDDESTLLWMIMGLETGYASQVQLEKGQGFVDSHVENGRYISPAGTRRSIIDALEFPMRSRLAYVAGLYAYEADLAAEKNLSTTQAAEEAAESYRQLASLTDGGYLPLSDTLKWIDPMAFLGEYLALTNRGKSTLGREIVGNTLATMEKWKLRERGLGLATEKGEPVPADMFINNDPYQGPRWFLWEHTFDAVCEMHGLNDGKYRSEKLNLLKIMNWREYLGAPIEKEWQVWNVYILKQQRDVAEFLSKGGLQRNIS